MFSDLTLLNNISKWKKEGKQPVIVAVGGGCNNNRVGTFAKYINADLHEVCTTMLCLNDAAGTSLKKAVNNVSNGEILSKNVIGCFYYPRSVVGINYIYYLIGRNNIASSLGEALKNAAMLADMAIPE